MERRTNAKSSKGITLIALVISIIIMLILAGVSINAVVGDNGVLGKATDAVYLQSAAVLEEYFNQLYAEGAIDGNEEGETPLDTIMKNGYQDYFFKTSEGYCLKKPYTNPNTGEVQTLVLYLVRRDQLPEDIQRQLAGPKELESRDYRKLRGVYGVTSDLKAYYCRNGVDSMLGLSSNDLNADSPDIVYAEPETPLASIINGGTEAITNQGLKSVSTLEIDSEYELGVLKDCGKLLNLTTIYFTGLSIPNLDGIENATRVNYVKFDTCNVNDYSKLSALRELTKLYIIYPSKGNEEIEILCSGDRGIANAEFAKLTTMAIVGNRYNIGSGWNHGGSFPVTSINPLSNLSTITKQAIKYMYINNLQLTSLAGLYDFINLYRIEAHGNKLLSLDGIEQMSQLTYLYVRDNSTLGQNETSTANASIDVLNRIYKNESGKNTSLYYLDITNDSQIKHVSYLSNCTNLKYLYMKGCGNLTDVATIASVMKNTNSYYIDSKYTLDIASGAKILDFKNQLLTVSQFETALKNNTTVKYLRLSGLRLKDASGTELTQTTTPTYDAEVNSVLKTCTNLICVWLHTSTNMKTIEFVKSTPNLQELMINNTYITTYNGDLSKNGLELLNTYCPKLGCLALGSLDANMDITKIQPALNKVSTNLVNYSKELFETSGDGCRGVVICGNYEKNKLGQCTDLTIFRGYQGGWGYQISTTVDMTACTKLKNIYYGYNSLSFKVPSSVETLLMGGVDMDKWDLSNATNLKNLSIAITGGNATALTRILEQLSDKTNLRYFNCMITYKYDTSNFSLLKDTGLTELYIYPYGGYPQNVGYVTKLGGIADITTLTKLQCCGNGLTSLDGIEKLTNLTYLDIQRNQLRNLNGLENLSNLVTLNAYSNQINDIYSIANLNHLDYINLNSNALTDFSTHTVNGHSTGYETLDVFYDLNYKKKGALKKLYISNNNIDDTEILLDLNWSDKSGF